MKNGILSPRRWFMSMAGVLAVMIYAGCESAAQNSTTNAPAVTSTNSPAKPPVRIKAGLFTPLKDSEGNTWLPDQGFADGETVERPGLTIANTKTPEIYHSERYLMSSFTYPVPNGKYIVKLHFCETFEGISAIGERIFSYNVEGQSFKDLDIFSKTGGTLRAYVHTVNVEIKDGKLDITFTQNVENPEINGIEILPGA